MAEMKSGRGELVAALLAKVDPFDKWPAASRQALCDSAEFWTYAKGEQIFPVDEPVPGVAVVVSGSVYHEREWANGGHLLINIARPGWPLRIPAAYDGGPTQYGLRARRDCEIILLPARRFRDIANADVDALKTITRFIALQHRQELSRIELSTVGSLACQIAVYLLLQSQDSFQVVPEVPETLKGQRLAPFDITQDELALMTGCSRQHVNSAMKGMERDGAIQRHGRLVEVVNYLKLLDYIEEKEMSHPTWRAAITEWQKRIDDMRSAAAQ